MMYSLPFHSSICGFYASWFNHTYHSAFLITSESVVLSYNYDIKCRILGSRTQRCQETEWLAAYMRWLDPWYKESLRHPVLEKIKLNTF